MDLPSAKRTLTATEIVASMAHLDGWHLDGDGAELAIKKTFTFADFAATMAFVNALAFIAQSRHHLPQLRLNNRHCTVRWHTHDVGGITRMDLESAARVDGMLAALTA